MVAPEGRMFPKQIKDLIAKIVERKNLTGIAVVEYSPLDEGHKTAESL